MTRPAWQHKVDHYAEADGLEPHEHAARYGLIAEALREERDHGPGTVTLSREMVGRLADYLQAGGIRGGNRDLWLAAIGDAMADELGEAVDAYWRARLERP